MIEINGRYLASLLEVNKSNVSKTISIEEKLAKIPGNGYMNVK